MMFRQTKGYAEAALQINRSIAVLAMVLSVPAVVFLPDKIAEYAFSVLVYSSVVFLITLPLDYMIPPFRIAAEFISELLYLSRVIVFCSNHRVAVCVASGIGSLCLWLPVAGVLFTRQENFWLMLFFAYAAIWALLYHSVAMMEKRDPLLDDSIELQEQHSNLFWTVWALLLSGCVAGCILPLVPYAADLLKGNPAEFSSFQQIMTAICAAGLIMLGIIGVVYRRYATAVRHTLEKIQLQHQMEQHQMYIKLLSEKYCALQRYQHDFKKHLAYIRQLAVQNRPEEIAAYIAVVQDDLQQGTLLRLTGNQTLDLLFSDYMQQAENNSIALQVQYQPQVKLNRISTPDLCIILGNLLDNAITAAAESEQKQIICEFWMKNDYYTAIQITNSCGQPPVLQDGVPQSPRNPEQHGYGVQNIIRCVRKYDGECIFRYDTVQKQFQVIILVPIV